MAGALPASRSQIVGTGSVITGWLAAGYDLGADILPTLAERTVSVRISPIRTWDYFTAAIAERHARRVAHEAGGDLLGNGEKAPPAATHRPAGPSPVPPAAMSWTWSRRGSPKGGSCRPAPCRG